MRTFLRFLSVSGVLGLAVVLAACDQSQPQAAKVAAPAQQGGYAPPPELTAAVRTPNGGVTLSGVAVPGAVVRLASPDGHTIGVTADANGAWSTTLPPAPDPRMFALDEDAAGRVLKAEGPVLALPAPGPPAVTPRAGFGALPVGRSGAPVITAVDYDAGGGTAVAGLAAPNTLVKLTIDGAQAGSDETDQSGRFAIAVVAPRRVPPGDHALEISAGSAVDTVRATFIAPAPLSGQFYRARREDGRWRVDWAVTGGGVQSTLVFDERPGR